MKQSVLIIGGIGGIDNAMLLSLIKTKHPDLIVAIDDSKDSINVECIDMLEKKMQLKPMEIIEFKMHEIDVAEYIPPATNKHFEKQKRQQFKRINTGFRPH